MNLNDLPPEAAKAFPGVVGSLAALLWIKDTWPRKAAMFVAGAAMSRYGAEWVAKLVGMNEGFAGFLLGMFGMAIAAKLFETWQGLELGLILRDWLRKMAGLPPAA